MRAGARLRLLSLLVLSACLLPAAAGAQVSISLVWHQPDLQTFYLSDFDPSDASLHPDLFTVSLINTAGVDTTIYLKFYIYFGATSDTRLLEAKSDPFVLGPGGEVFTNRELTNDQQPFGLVEAIFDEEAAGDLAETALETGLLPSNTYSFRLEAYSYPAGVLLNTAQYVLTVSNPTRVDLIGPGASFGGVLPVVATPNPQFFWSTDASAATLLKRYLIRVVRVQESGSAEEAIQGFATWEGEINDATTAIYPSSVESIPLEPGATYAWQVERLVETSSGVARLESEIFWFKMEDQNSGFSGSSVDEEVDAMINQIAGLQGVSGELAGFRPTGQVLVDGKPTDLNSLRGLLEQVLNGALQIATIIIR